MTRAIWIRISRVIVGGLMLVTTLASPALGLEPARRHGSLADDPIPSFWVAPDRKPRAATIRATPPAATEQSQLQAALDRARTVTQSYGLSFAIVRGDGVAWSGATGAGNDGRTRLEADTPFVIGSVTKTFVTVALLRLVEDGRFALDDQVTDLLPGVTVARGATVRDLLAHTSGIADLYPPLKVTLSAEPSHVFSHDEVLSRLGTAWFAPGKGWGYSNTNFVIAGMLLEEVTGEAAEEVIGELVQPLGLYATWLLAGERADPALLEPSWATSFWTSGAMRSTVADLARWGAALYGGSVLEPADLALMTTFNKDEYGLGTRRFEMGEYDGIGHSGLLKTTTTLLIYFPEQRTSIAIAANRSDVDLPGALVAKVKGQPSLIELALRPAPPAAPVAQVKSSSRITRVDGVPWASTASRNGL